MLDDIRNIGKLVLKNKNIKGVFIELDDDAVDVWNAYKELKQMDYVEKRRRWLEIRKQFKSYVISIENYYDLPVENVRIKPYWN